MANIKQNQILYNSIQKHTLGVLQSRDLFRRAGGRQDTINPGFSDTDTPATLYFKIFFCFRNGRLLDITEPMPEGFQLGSQGSLTSVSQNSALNYLYTNGEFERANMLKQFVVLLSNINMYSPWYFQSISGMDQLLQHTELGGNEFTPVSDEAKGITIKCLEDAYDQRIGTLLDLYKAACFSQQLHKEIVPANLRKFDMVIYLFSTPIKGVNGNLEQSALKDTTDNTIISSKLIEMKNCEISLSSNSTAYSELSNVEGIKPEYTIAIKCDAAYEQRYNKILNTYIGDLVEWDTNYRLNLEDQRIKYDRNDWVESSISNLVNNIAESAGDSIGESLGSTKISKMMQKFGISSMVDKVNAKVKDVVQKFDPIRNGKALVNEGISSLSQAMNNAVSDITFGNIYHDDKFINKGFEGWINDLGKGDNTGRTSPTSSLGTNLYRGWTKH